MGVFCFFFFFFFKQKTAYEISVRDWSSDVCSSDLPEGAAPQLGQDGALQTLDEAVGPWVAWPSTTMLDLEALARRHEHALELGPAVGQHRLQPLSDLLQCRHHDLAQEASGRRRVVFG